MIILRIAIVDGKTVTPEAFAQDAVASELEMLRAVVGDWDRTQKILLDRARERIAKLEKDGVKAG